MVPGPFQKEKNRVASSQETIMLFWDIFDILNHQGTFIVLPSDVWFSLYCLMGSSNNYCGWQITKKLMKSWKICYASELLSIITELERNKIFPGSLQWEWLFPHLWRSPNMWKLCCSPFLSAFGNFVKLLRDIMCFTWAFQALASLRWEPDSPLWLQWSDSWYSLFYLFRIFLLWIRRAESCSNSSSDGKEVQNALAPMVLAWGLKNTVCLVQCPAEGSPAHSCRQN